MTRPTRTRWPRGTLVFTDANFPDAVYQPVEARLDSTLVFDGQIDYAEIKCWNPFWGDMHGVSVAHLRPLTSAARAFLKIARGSK